MPQQDINDAISNTTRLLAQHVTVLALVRLHPDPQALRDLVDQFAEATRANLLATNWTDEQVQQFDKSLGLLLNTLPPPSAK